MKKYILAFLLSLSAAYPAGAVPTCEQQLQSPNDTAEKRAMIARACEKPHAFERCQKVAVERKLQGSARTSFMQQCANVPPPKSYASPPPKKR